MEIFITNLQDLISKTKGKYINLVVAELLDAYNKISENKINMLNSDYFIWKLRYYPIFKKSKGFDFIIANPPYVRPQHAKELQKTYPNLFSLKGNNKDLYLGFLEQSLNLLNTKGKLSFVLPNFNRQKSGEDIQKYLIKHNVDLWVDFRDNQVFENASNYVSLLF